MATASSPKRSRPKSFLVDLPSDVIDTIISHLPIRDAVKTSILSRTWRHRWRSIPDLHVDARGSGGAAFVDLVLLLHNGPIRSFSLSLDGCWGCDIRVERWLSAVNPVPLRSLILCFDRRRDVSSAIFSFCSLTHLELRRCILPEDPDELISFRGFPSLQTLVLNDCSFPCASEIISGCPLLQNLILTDIDGGEEGCLMFLPTLCILPSNLRSLVFCGALEEFQLVSAPLLTTVTLDLIDIVPPSPSEDDSDDDLVPQVPSDDDSDDGLVPQVPLDDDSDEDYVEAIDREDSYYEGDCNLINMFGHAQNIEKLELLSLSLRFLGECGLPEFTFSFERLKILTMKVEFEFVKKSLSTALWVLMCSPNLEELEIIGSRYYYIQEKTNITGQGFWRKQDRFELSKLRMMKFTRIILGGREIQFMTFMLPRAQGLKKMVIDVSPDDDGSVIDKSLAEDFMKSLRDSTQAEITLTGLT